MDQIKIGKFILNCRKEKGLTQEKLAEKLGRITNVIQNEKSSKFEQYEQKSMNLYKLYYLN